MNYLIVVDARCYPVRPGCIATESAFAAHLRMLRERLGPRFDRMILVAPVYTQKFYEQNQHHLGHLDEEQDGISLIPLYRDGDRVTDYWTKDLPRLLPRLWRAVKSSSVVHSGLAHDLYRPTAFLALVMAVVLRRKSLFFVDIDFRDKARQHRVNGSWSTRTYLACRYLFDPLRRLQVWLAARFCSLTLLKSARMVEDYGRGRPSVRNFFDTAHSPEHIIPDEALEKKLERLRDVNAPLRLVYFGRFVAYKGLDRTIRAVHAARERSGRPFELLLIGTGDQASRIQDVIEELGAQDWVAVHEPVPFGPQLFELLYAASLHIATPLIEDTPRAAFDAMASGLPILAFDIAYYRDLEQMGAVATARWPDAGALADALIALDSDRAKLAAMAQRGVEVARENTQEIWLDRRIRWTLALLDEN